MANLLDSAGNQVFNKLPVGGYIGHINHRHTGADSAGSTFWGFRNGGARVAQVRHIRGQLTFDGTAAAATTLRYGFFKLTGASTEPSAGSNVSFTKKQTGYPASSVTIRQGAALTYTSATPEAEPFHVIALPVSVTNGVSPFFIDFVQGNQPQDFFELLPNEGIALIIRNTNAVVGFTISGSIEWDEYAV